MHIKRVYCYSTFLLLLFVFFFSYANCESIDIEQIEQLDQMVSEKTQEWELKYGDYRLWNYETNALFAQAIGSVPGNSFSNYALPTLPQEEDITEETAIATSLHAIPLYNDTVTEEVLSTCFVSTRFSKAKDNASYIMEDGTWIVKCWMKDIDLGLICYVYIDSRSGDAYFAYFPGDAVYVGSPETAERIEE